MKTGKRIQLDEVCEVEYGTRVVRKRDGGSAYPVYGGGGATFQVDDFNREDRLVIARFGMSEACTRFVTGKFFLNDSGLTVSPKNGVLLPRYLDYQLLALNDDIYALGKGAAQKNLDVPAFRTLSLFVPSDTVDQQRVIDTLDEALDGIAATKANVERNLLNARVLFESYLHSIFTKRGEKWATKPLGLLCSLFVDSAHRTPKYQTDGIPALRPRDVANGILTLAETARVSDEECEIQSKRHRPAPGDIVYSRELTYGWAAILPQAPRVCLSQGMCLFRPTPDLDSAFLLYVLNGPVGRDQATRAAVGAAHPHINLGDIKGYLIPLPPLSEQREITRKLDAMAKQIQGLEALYRSKLAALEALKKSFLQQAFAGELATVDSIQWQSTAVPYPAISPETTTTDLHAGILAMAFEQHKRNGKLKLFTHVKAEKIAHMVEARLGIDLGRLPVKDAAGPNDFPHLKKVEHRARKANYFDFKLVGTTYQVQTLGGFERLIEKTHTVLGGRLKEVELLLTWMLRMDVQQAEIVATVFAAWNNLLLDGRRPTAEQIVFEARENWHPDKLGIERYRFFKAVEWLRQEGAVPEGKGKRVRDKGNLM